MDRLKSYSRGHLMEEVNFRIENNRLTEVDFALEAVLYGKYAAVFGKDLSAIESPLSRATVDNAR